VARHAFTVAVLAAACLQATTGCRSNQPLHASAVQLGRSLNSDGSVGGHTTVFKPEDTIYVAVLTTDTGRGTIRVRWEYSGVLISEPSKDVSLVGAGATEFHIQNSGGFPAGTYSVEAFLDGQSVGRRAFTVEKPDAKKR
jgi:hypothetical protein